MSAPDARYCAVVFDVPLDTRFTYAIPADAPPVTRGCRVVAPWRNRALTGVVVDADASLPEGLDAAKVRPIADVLDARAAIPEAQLAICEWISGYYQAAIGACVRLASPPDGGRKSRRRVYRTGAAAPPDLSEVQAQLLASLEDAGAVGADPSELVSSLSAARHADLAALEDARLVVSRYTAEAGQRAKTVDRLVWIGRDGKRIGDAQARVVEHLEANGSATDAELRAAFNTPRTVIKALVARGMVRLEVEEVIRDPFSTPATPRDTVPTLTDDQSAALAEIDAAGGTKPATVLMHGVTGSGKTEVYVRAAEAALARGERTLILLPEIALTPQFVGVFRSALPVDIAVLHSGLTPGERFDQWRRIRAGEVDIVIGARSALFAPLENVGLIIVDEEHDPSFKQGEGVLYNARDVAVVLAHRQGAVCVLGSATPSLESLHNARQGRYRLAALPRRVAGRPMPVIDVIDMAHHGSEFDEDLGSYVSPPLAAKVRQAARRGEQAILFLNRRGYAPMVSCLDCQETLKCADCDIALTYHRARNEVACHYCGFTAKRPTHCPTCRSENLHHEGAGTERIVEVVAEAFSDLRVGRLDRDTSRGKGLQRVLDAFRRRELDVLVGTQMVTKGHDFPNVTLVGVLDADQSLRFPDFRSGERTFQLLTQVAGRAGRGEIAGEVLVQTFQPEHFVVQAVADGDYDAFAARELAFRERLIYPPFGYLFALRVNSPRHDHAWGFAEQVVRYIKTHGDPTLRVTGPADAPIARVRNRYRVQAMIRAAERGPIRQAARLARSAAEAMEKAAGGRDVRWSLDVDAIRLL